MLTLKFLVPIHPDYVPTSYPSHSLPGTPHNPLPSITFLEIAVQVAAPADSPPNPRSRTCPTPPAHSLRHAARHAALALSVRGPCRRHSWHPRCGGRAGDKWSPPSPAASLGRKMEMSRANGTGANHLEEFYRHHLRNVWEHVFKKERTRPLTLRKLLGLLEHFSDSS